MTNFKKGDKVIGRWDGSGYRGVVVTVNHDGSGVVLAEDGREWFVASMTAIEDTKINKIMSTLKDRVAVMFKGEPEKSFIKAGVMNTDETLTTDGETIFKQFLFKRFAADFKKEVVDPLLAEDKE